jgi:predicted enzyme related to lactoylglutathione lyase
MTTPTTSSARINNVNWFEIAVSDLDRSAALYEAALDTKLKRDTFMEVPHAMFPCKDGAIGALITDPKRPPQGGASTVIYLRVDDVGHAVSRAAEAGAKIVQPLTSIGPMGWIALFADFDGNIVGLHAEAVK